MRSLQKKIIGDLRAQSGAFLAVWLTIVLGLSFYGSTYPAGVALIDSVLDTYNLLNFADFNARFEMTSPDEVLESVAAIEGVETVEGRLVIEAGLELDSPGRLTLRMISLPNEGHPQVNNVLVAEGDEQLEAGEIFLLESFAKYHRLKIGDSLNVWINEQSHDLTVAGFVFSPEYVIAGESSAIPYPQPSRFGVGYIQYEQLVSLIGQGNMINEVVLTTTEDADEEAIRAELESSLAPYDPEFVYSRLQTASGAIVDSNIQGNFPIGAFFSGMFLLISALVMAVLLARVMDSETRRIGTMRALGLSRDETLRHYMTFPLIIGISGAVAGSILGYILSFFVAQYFIVTLFGGSLPTFRNDPQWAFILFGFGLVFFLALLAGIWPIWRASKTDPGLALRPATPKGMGAGARVTIPGLPLSARQALRNMLRVPSRTVNTFLGVLIGFIVILVASGMADMTKHFFKVQFEDGQDFDLQIIWNTPNRTSVYESLLNNIEGIEDFEMMLAGPITASYQDNALDTFAFSVDETTDYFTFETVSGDDAFASNEAVWIGHNLARVLNIEPGDTLSIKVLGQTNEVPVGGVVNLGAGSLVFVPTSLIQQWLPLNISLSNAGLIRVTHDNFDTVYEALLALDGVMSVEVVADTHKDLKDYSSLYLNFSYLFQGFGYLLTVVVLFNTISVNLHERREELAIMRAMGSSIGEIALTITWETMSITIIAMIVAISPAWTVLGILMGNYDTDFSGFLTYIAPQSYVIAAAGLIISVLFAEWLNLRSLSKADLGYLSKSLSM